jgi:branched-chain amino acid transport system permease protein
MGPVLAAAVAAQAAASLALMARGVVIILFLIFEPRGLVHLWGAVKAYVRLWPFSREEAE